MKAPSCALLLLLACGPALHAYDSDAPDPVLRKKEAVAVAVPVRISVLHLTHGDKGRVQSTQLPVILVEGKRRTEVRIDDRLYAFTTAPGRPGRFEIGLEYSVRRPGAKEYRLAASRRVVLLPNRLSSVSAGREEFRFVAMPVSR